MSTFFKNTFHKGETLIAKRFTICLSISQSVYQYIRLSVYPSTSLSVSLPVYFSIKYIQVQNLRALVLDRLLRIFVQECEDGWMDSTETVVWRASVVCRRGQTFR